MPCQSFGMNMNLATWRPSIFRRRSVGSGHMLLLYHWSLSVSPKAQRAIDIPAICIFDIAVARSGLLLVGRLPLLKLCWTAGSQSRFANHRADHDAMDSTCMVDWWLCQRY